MIDEGEEDEAAIKRGGVELESGENSLKEGWK